MDEPLSAQWARIRGRLRAEYGEAAYRSWLKPLTLQGLDESRVRIAVPTRFMRDWVEQQYGPKLFHLWSGEHDGWRGIEFVLAGLRPAQQAPHGKSAKRGGQQAAAPAHALTPPPDPPSPL